MTPAEQAAAYHADHPHATFRKCVEHANAHFQGEDHRAFVNAWHVIKFGLEVWPDDPGRHITPSSFPG